MTKTADRRATDESKRKKVGQEKKEKEKAALLKRDIRETFATGFGQRTLRYIMDLCGYQRPSVVADPSSGEVMTQSTVYNEARRNLYLTLRKYVSVDVLRKVENKGLEQDEENNLFT